MTPAVAPRWMVVLDSRKCTLCEVCAARCPTSALGIERRADMQSLTFEPARCDACDGEVRCQTACPEECLAVVHADRRRLPGPRLVLAAGKLVRCSGCGATFAAQRKLQIVGRRAGERPRDLHRRCPSCRRDRLLSNLIS